jgi:hypothetical protein
MNSQRLSELIEAHLDGTLTVAGAEKLSRAIVEEPEVRRQFWNHTALHGLTQEAARLEWLGSAAPDVESKVVRVSWWRWTAPIAAAAAVLLSVAWWQRTPRENVRANTVAVLSRVVGVEWADATDSHSAGTALVAGSLRLKSGAIQVEFYSGARVVVEGPAEFRLVSAREAFLATGRLTAHVPAQARGFKIGSSALTVVDLGTDFGVTIPASGPAEVHVFSGKVEVALNAEKAPAPRPVVGGEAVRLEAGALRDLRANRATFLGEPELAQRDSEGAQQRYTAWLDSSRSLSADPATVIHFTCEKQAVWERALLNQAPNANDETRGNIVGCEWVEGRWPGKRALEFRGEGDRVRFHIGTPLNAVTFFAWLRVDGLPHSTHALFNADGERPGALRWELTHSGKLRLGVARPSSRPEANWEALNSPVVVAPERLGQWLLLASVFDGKRISHYVDGQLVSSGQAEGPTPMILGDVELGNWAGAPDRKDVPSRGFTGRIDEFVLLARAVAAEEMRALYQAGRPDAPTH